MKKGFVVSAVLYPLLIIVLTLIMGVISMSDNRRKILDNMKLEVSEESETDPEMTNSSLYYKIKVLEEAYAELNTRFSEEYFDEVKTQAKLESYPVGNILISTNNTNPSSYIGGTWETYGSGRTLVGVDTNQSEFNTVNKTGGSKSFNNNHSHTVASHTHTINSHSHTTQAHTLTINEMPAHTHSYAKPKNAYAEEPIKGSSVLAGNTLLYDWQVYKNVNSTGGSQPHSHGNTGGSGTLTTQGNPTQTTGLTGSSSQSLLQPYITVYFWKRVA